MMMGVKELKKAVYIHLVAGVIFSTLFFAALLLAGYRDSLVRAEDSLVRIRRNIVSMEATIEDIRFKKRLIGSVIPADYSKRSNREIMLISLEKARMQIPGASISVAGFVEEGDDITLPVVFEFPVLNYYDAIRSIGYLEGQNFPHFKVKGVVIRKGEDGSGVMGRVDGSFMMPSERLGTAIGG